jgi:hypothetical protein
MVVVNVVACNTDAHAKNHSIMIRGNGASLAPMYDVMCGEVWEHVTKQLALKIAGKRRGDDLEGRDWQRFARACGLNPKQVLDRVGTLAKAALAEAEAAAAEVADTERCRTTGRCTPRAAARVRRRTRSGIRRRRRRRGRPDEGRDRGMMKRGTPGLSNAVHARSASMP